MFTFKEYILYTKGLKYLKACNNMKRGIGERARVLFDEIDLKILELLNHPSPDYKNNRDKRYGILEIAGKLDLKHKNLKPHIDKLLRLELIFPYENEGKLYITTGLQNFKDMGEDVTEMAHTKSEQEQILKQLSEEKILLNYLKKVSEQFRGEELKKRVAIDFRKIKSELSKNKQPGKSHP